MPNELTTVDAKAVAAQDFSAAVDRAYRSITRDGVGEMLAAPLDSGFRRALQDYRREMHAKLRPISMAAAEEARAKTAIGFFLQGYINAKSNNPTATVESYAAMLRDQPLWAIMDAIADFQNGRVFDVDLEGRRVPFTLDHAPTGPRLLAQVKKCTESVVAERHKAIKLLSITRIEPQQNPEVTKRIADLMNGLASEMKVGAATIRAQERQKIRAEADAARDRAARIKHEAALRRATA